MGGVACSGSAAGPVVRNGGGGVVAMRGGDPMRGDNGSAARPPYRCGVPAIEDDQLCPRSLRDLRSLFDSCNNDRNSRIDCASADRLDSSNTDTKPGRSAVPAVMRRRTSSEP